MIDVAGVEKILVKFGLHELCVTTLKYQSPNTVDGLHHTTGKKTVIGRITINLAVTTLHYMLNVDRAAKNGNTAATKLLSGSNDI